MTGGERDEERAEEGGESGQEFGELLKYTLAGFGGGILLGAALDKLGYKLSAVGQWLVRTLSGEGETLLEGLYAVRRRLAGGPKSLAQAYGWGKLAGLAVPWLVDWGSRLVGVNVYGVESFYIPFLYAMSDQIGANVSGFLYMRRREPTWRAAWARYARNPVMIASLAVVLAAPAGLLAARLLGFSPTSQVRTAVETIAANLCWIPPLVGWLGERRGRRSRRSPGKES